METLPGSVTIYQFFQQDLHYFIIMQVLLFVTLSHVKALVVLFIKLYNYKEFSTERKGVYIVEKNYCDFGFRSLAGGRVCSERMRKKRFRAATGEGKGAAGSHGSGFCSFRI